ncbi:FtsK/SpoIIIE domain-containing protein [Nanchangia anserum]|uniref:FtsK domain-containing protein n=1 Tax=Nanchangia anserum TaxID=2692125 RepID=A0A8I0GA00_9ACTO|nr:FtsK/SpoIIIE domain-containing protein [Nanchangia anserum]MBD3689894.1 hypothetical protein [Nanchangia anserum]
MPALSPPWWDELCGYLEAHSTAHDDLPALVKVDERLAGETDLTVSSLINRWRPYRDESTPDHLRAWLGIGEAGAVDVDLVCDGPHALVAGTTGSGKSEALVTWLLGLAWRYPPSQLGLVLVDYKGGETFAALAPLPHVCGVVSDLDAQATRRALQSLTAELARRERLRQARRSVGRRLIVVIDEFRRLAEDEPELLTSLLRIATIGRSLGVHVILATQRPAGIVDHHMRANLPLRLCLRVLENADSHDVLGTSAAAHLPRVPGRGILMGNGHVQVAYVGNQEEVKRHVTALRTAWDTLAPHRLDPPWAPPLPDRIDWNERTKWSDAPDHTAIGWHDLPTEQRICSLTLPSTLSALVVGAPGSGRTTAARACARAFAERGIACHVIARPGTHWPEATTLLSTTDVALAWELLMRVTHLSGLVVIDGVDDLLSESDRLLGIGAMSELLASLARRRGPDAHVVLTGSATLATARWTHSLRQHIVLPIRHPMEAAHVGLTTRQCDDIDRPGRAIWMEDGHNSLVHFATPPSVTPARATDSSHPIVVPLREPPPHSSADVIAMTTPENAPLRITKHRSWIVACAPGPLRESLRAVVTRAYDEVGQPASIIDLDGTDIPSAFTSHRALVVFTSPSRLRQTYAGPLHELRENAGVIVCAHDSELRAMVPPDFTHLAALDPSSPARGLYISRGVAHQLALRRPPM